MRPPIVEPINIPIQIYDRMGPSRYGFGPETTIDELERRGGNRPPHALSSSGLAGHAGERFRRLLNEMFKNEGWIDRFLLLVDEISMPRFMLCDHARAM